MRAYQVSIVGKTPLLMHADNIEWADKMDAWKDDPNNKGKGRAGDDRTPAFRWLGSLYHDDEVVTIPNDNLMRCLMEGGTMVPVPKGKGGKTFKAQTQSGCMIGEPFWPLVVKGKTISSVELFKLMDEPNYEKHQEAVARLGFMLYLKRARIGQKKHIRVRPRFDDWRAEGTINVWDDQLTLPVLEEIFHFSGQYRGLCDWRPGAPQKPGPHGMFETTIHEV